MNENCLALLRLDTQKHMKSAIAELANKVHLVRSSYEILFKDGVQIILS